MLYDLAAKSETELLSLDGLEKAAVAVPESERFDWQNRRVSENSVQWSQSGRQLLLGVRGDLFLYSFESGKWDQLTATAKPSAIQNSRPTAHAWHFDAATTCTLSRSLPEGDAAHRRRLRHPAQRRAGLGLSGRTGSRDRLLVVARFPAHRVSAVRHRPRVRLSAGCPDRAARHRRAGTLSASRHAQRRRPAGHCRRSRREHPLDGSGRCPRRSVRARLLDAGLHASSRSSASIASRISWICCSPKPARAASQIDPARGRSLLDQ